MAGEIKVKIESDARHVAKLLREAEGRTPKEIQVANVNSAEIAAQRARTLAPKGPHQGGGRVQPHWTTIKVQATTRKAWLVFGGARAPHSAVINFGGTIPRFHSVTRTHVLRREHIYQAIAQTAPQRKEEYEKAINRIVHSLL